MLPVSQDRAIWTAAFEAAMAGYLAGAFPIGACVVSSTGELLAVRSNASDSHVIEHAETRAIRAVSSERALAGAAIYSTLEPCPMCTGAIRIARLARLHFAAYDPAAGDSAHLAGSPFMAHLNCRLVPPTEAELEKVLVALTVECRLRLGKMRWHEAWLARYPNAFALGVRLHDAARFDRWRAESAGALKIYEEVLSS